MKVKSIIKNAISNRNPASVSKFLFFEFTKALVKGELDVETCKMHDLIYEYTPHGTRQQLINR